MSRRGRLPSNKNYYFEEVVVEKEAQAPSLIRVVHAAPAAPNVDVSLDGRRVLSNVAYKVASDYLEVKPGNHLIQVNVAGTQNTVLQARVDVQAGDAYTVVAHGDVKKKLALLLLKDDNSCPIPNEARVRFVHASYAAPRVNVYANKTLALFPNVGYGEAKVAQVPAGSYDLSVTPVNSSTVVLNLPGVALEPGHVYTVIATGIPGDAKYPLGVILTQDSSCMYVTL
jgi:hypothetical protein